MTVDYYDHSGHLRSGVLVGSVTGPQKGIGLVVHHKDEGDVVVRPQNMRRLGKCNCGCKKLLRLEA